MKAIYLTKYGGSEQAFEIRDIPIPQPGEGEVLIKVKYSGLNFADVIARRGLYPDAPPNPALLGYDVSGTVESIGEGVTGVNIGQKVVAMTRFGGYGEYAVTHQSGVAILDEDADLAAATALATQACTAYYCAIDCTTLHSGDRVLVH
ncbi:MAG: alcohol dehydrogenase catalytic domain-containing protein, partial [Saprospiraceae bacterium]